MLLRARVNTGACPTKGAASQVKCFLEADDDILDVFALFGVSPEIPPAIHRQMEQYICPLYKAHDIIADVVKSLCWMLFSSEGKEGQQHPPNLGTPIPHTGGAYHIALVWKSSTTPCPTIPAATNYYWKREDIKLKPVFCTYPLTPEDILQH